jgi:hypothetical protein
VSVFVLSLTQDKEEDGHQRRTLRLKFILRTRSGKHNMTPESRETGEMMMAIIIISSGGR